MSSGILKVPSWPIRAAWSSTRDLVPSVRLRPAGSLMSQACLSCKPARASHWGSKRGGTATRWPSPHVDIRAFGTSPFPFPTNVPSALQRPILPPATSIILRAYGRRISWKRLWRRAVHTEKTGSGGGRGRRARMVGIRRSHRSSKPTVAPPPSRRQNEVQAPKDGAAKDGPKKTTEIPKAVVPPPKLEQEATSSYMSKYLHLPHISMPHRPTKEELLAAASGFWERVRVRFKWMSIRSMRPWNADEWGAFISWIILSHLVWILVGTTTFFSLVVFSINTVFAQETLAKWIGDYLTQSAGVTVVFESAIVPKWKDGVISLRKVFVSRRPGQMQSSVSKGSSSNAAAVAAAKQAGEEKVEDDGNYTQFDLTIETVNVTLSFLKWWNGKGPLKDVEIKGVRGEVDRRSVAGTGPVDPLSYRYEHEPGDFEIDYFKIEDLKVTVHQPAGFRPFEASIFSCELPQLRKQWLFYDLLSASNMSGSYDGSLFTIHTPQVDGALGGDHHSVVDTFGNPDAWKKSTRFRIDGLRVDHLNRGVDGPFGWIYEGQVDIVADVMLPADEEEGLSKVVADFYDQLEDLVVSNRLRLLKRDDAEDLPRPPNPFFNSPYPSTNAVVPPSLLPEEDQKMPHDKNRQYVVFDLRIRLHDVKAAVPLLTRDIGYINQALVRPIVAYINAKRTYIPVACRFAKRRSDFDGSWTVYDSGLMNDLSAETYSAFARNVEDQHLRVRRLKKVSGWTLSLLIHAICGGMAGSVL